MTPKKQTVYVRNDNGVQIGYLDGNPIQRHLTDIKSLASAGHIDINAPCSFERLQNDVVTAYVHEKKEGYFFTEEELLALRRKWAGEGFDVGYDYKISSQYHPGSVDVTDSPNKPTYLNNLTIE